MMILIDTWLSAENTIRNPNTFIIVALPSVRPVKVESRELDYIPRWANHEALSRSVMAGGGDSTANPAPALTAIDRASNRPYMGDLRHRGCYSGPAN